MTTTTLNAIRAYSPCEGGWEKLLKHLGKTKADDEPLTFETILESNGVDDAYWCLRSLGEEHHRNIRLLAADVAERVLPIWEKAYPDDNRPRLAIQAARDFANGLIDEKTLVAARAAEAAWDADAAGAARDAARAVAWAAEAAEAADAAWAACAAAWAARATVRAAACAARDSGDAECKAQAELLLKYFGNKEGQDD